MITRITLGQARSALERWAEELRSKELAPRTVANYTLAASDLLAHLEGACACGLDRAGAVSFKSSLIELRDAGAIKTSTANLKISGANAFLDFLGFDSDARLAHLKVQEPLTLENVITKSDYTRLIRWADRLTEREAALRREDLRRCGAGEIPKGKVHRARDWTREKMIMKTLAGTGVRVSELFFFTVEALRASANGLTVTNKGKTRFVAVPARLRRELLDYAEENGVVSGVIFHGRDPSQLLDQSAIWRGLRRIAGQARVKKSKVHPHSFRHFFAKQWVQSGGDLLTLKSQLGHSSLKTVAVYQMQSERERRDGMREFYRKLNDGF